MNTYTMLTHLDYKDDFDPARVTIVQGVRYEVDDTPMGIQFEATEDMKWFVAESKFREYKSQCWAEIEAVEDERTQDVQNWADRVYVWSMIIGLSIVGIVTLYVSLSSLLK